MKNQNTLKKTYSAILLFSILFVSSAVFAQSWETNGNSGIGSSDFLGTTDSANIIIKTDDIERIRITDQGLVGIGSQDPDAKLTVSIQPDENNIPLVIETPMLPNLSPSLEAFFAVRHPYKSPSGVKYSTDFVIKPDGKVGIGTNDPGTDLEIQSTNPSLLFNGAFSSLEVTASACQGCNSPFAEKGDSVLRTLSDGNATSPDLIFSIPTTGETGTRAVIFADSDEKIMTIMNGGKNSAVGIGTSLTNNPNGYKLAVNGRIGAKSIQVEDSSLTWSDYVFEKNYRLPPLKEVEEHILNNKRLSDLPSAAEVKEKGINLAQMDATLLKKIEELTLYAIDLNKKLEDQANLIVQLQKQK